MTILNNIFTLKCMLYYQVEFHAARKRYSTISLCNPILKLEFDVWKIKGKEKLIAYRKDEISANEFKTWFMDDEWTKS